MTVRRAVEQDLDAMVALSSAARDRLQGLEPVFWRRHRDADAAQRPWFQVLLSDAAHAVFVSETSSGDLDGFAMAVIRDAPPVYDPGGRTCLVDDLVGGAREVVEALLSAVRQTAAARGCSQLVVVTPAADDERRTLLGDLGLHSTSEWWTGPI